MSFSSAIAAAASAIAQKSPIQAYDYLSGGPGLTELQRVAADAVAALVSGAPVSVVLPSQGTATQYYTVAASPVVSAIWGPRKTTAQLYGAAVVTTAVAEQKQLSPASRQTVWTLASTVVKRVSEGMYANGDPSACVIAFEASLSAFANAYPALKTASGWCARDLVLKSDCSLTAICASTVDATGKAVPVATAAPPVGALVAGASQSAFSPRPAPTRADVDAAAAQYGMTMEAQRQQQELSTYLSALGEARKELTLALGIPVTASDADLWSSLGRHGISAAEAIDWFVSCDAGIDCFRQRMNHALGEAETQTRDDRAKLFALTGAALAVGFAYLTWRKH